MDKWLDLIVFVYSVWACVYVKGFILPEIGNHTQTTSADTQTKWLIKLYYLLNKSLADFIVCIVYPQLRRKTKIAVTSQVFIYTHKYKHKQSSDLFAIYK